MQNAASISKESCAALHKCIKEVIEKAVEVGADNSQFPSNWIFHSREMKPGKAFVDGKKIEFINAGGRTSAFVPELQRLSGSQAAKAPGKQRKIPEKSKDEDGDDDGPEESEIEEAARCVKSKGKNTNKQGGKKPPAKGKNKANDIDSADEEEEEEEQEEQQQHIRGKKPPAKIKSKEIDKDDGDQMKKTQGKRPPTKRKSRDDEHDNSSDDDDDDDDNKNQKKAIKGKQSNVEKTSRKKVETSQTGKQLKKRAK